MKFTLEYQLPNKTGLGRPRKLTFFKHSDEPIPRVGEFVKIGSEYFTVSKILWSLKQDLDPLDFEGHEVTIILRHSDGWFKTGQ
jgi:hypothetical protein